MEGLSTHLMEKWKIALTNGNVVSVTFIDFKKAFDCVSHSILIDLKLQALGFSGSALEWIRNTLKTGNSLLLSMDVNQNLML